MVGLVPRTRAFINTHPFNAKELLDPAYLSILCRLLIKRTKKKKKHHIPTLSSAMNIKYNQYFHLIRCFLCSIYFRCVEYEKLKEKTSGSDPDTLNIHHLLRQ